MSTVLRPVVPWRHDLCGCLQATVGTVLRLYGHDPAIVLGAAWDFYYPPGDCRQEEFYYPCRWPSLVQSLAPYHPVTSRWHAPADADAGWAGVRGAVQRGTPPVVAVDSYFVPFRPAYRDVHAAHLVVVYGFDEPAGHVYVCDPIPPSFDGPMRLDDLRAARASANPAVHDRDMFFADTPIGHRWLEVESTGPFPALTREWVGEVLAANVRRFREPAQGPALSGMGGLARYLSGLSGAAAGEGGTAAMDELFVLGGAVQESTALHADFLVLAGRRLSWPRLAEVGRRVDRLAHHWTTLRYTGGRWRAQPSVIADRLAGRVAQLLADQREVLEEMEWLSREP